MIIQTGSENEMFSFFKMTPDLVCVAGKDGYFRNFNHAVVQKLGYNAEELLSQPISEFIHPEDREVTARRRVELLNGKALTNFYNRYVSKTGEIVWLHWTSVYLPDQEVVFAIAKDVTARKQQERTILDKYRKFKSLASHFKTRLEKDKEFLAVELHEELAQLAAVLKMNIDWVSQHLKDIDEESALRMEQALSICDILIESIRKISYSLFPNMIKDVGLKETLLWLCNEFSVRTGVPCEFICTIETEKITQEIKLDIFRFCQESLDNISQNAHSGNVKVVAETIDKNISISVIDHGNGVETSQNLRPGITGMKKRAATVNGQVKINSINGRGSGIRFTIPLLTAYGKMGKTA
jgi:PAS domain S-box-containing protein